MGQLAFDMEFTDPTSGEVVPWSAASDALIADIRDAAWKVADVETTGLNPASPPQNFSGKDLRRGVDPTLRLRINSVTYPSAQAGGIRTVAFEFDKLSQVERKAVCNATLNNVLFAHNAGFDAYWLMDKSEWETVPTMLLDSMLIARILFPEQLLKLAELVSDESTPFDIQQEASDVFIQERSGWALADLSLTILGEIMPKDLQGPKNWCQPFLTLANFDYATMDARNTYRILKKLFKAEDGDLLKAYMRVREEVPMLKTQEPQVWDVLKMRRRGMPWAPAKALRYVQSKKELVGKLADELISLVPAAARFKDVLPDMDAGISAELKQVIGEAFTQTGLVLERTDSKDEYKIGEKDLRKARALQYPASKKLFSVWVGIARAKKAASMAMDFTGYAQRSKTGRIHANTGHGPATGRLSSSEPNCQQAPRDQEFRDCVEADEGKVIVASDYSALDMRVGAALAIRAQLQIWDAYMGVRQTHPEVLRCLTRVLDGQVDTDGALFEYEEAQAQLEHHMATRERAVDTKKFWDRKRKLDRILLLARFTYRLAQVHRNAKAAGTQTWGSLRNAFDIKGMDIHTWTALGMLGRDPQKEFEGLTGEQVVKRLKELKAELGDKRQTGKVGNLSLLYAMKTRGLVDAAAKNYDIHWTYEEGDAVRLGWLDTYIEIDLWHAWVELNPKTFIRIPDSERPGQTTSKQVYLSETLGGRQIYALGLNAALAYDDQSTGADILARVMNVFATELPEIEDCIVNQVHDEVVFEVPEDKIAEYLPLIEHTMNECAEYFLRPFGVRGECSPAVGKVWLKE